MFTYLVPTSGNETTPYQNCSGDESILNGFSTTRTHVNYSFIPASATTSTTNGKRLNMPTTQSKTDATDLLQAVPYQHKLLKFLS